MRERNSSNRKPGFSGGKSKSSSSGRADKPSFKKEGGKSFDKPKRSYGDRDERPSFKKEGGYGKSERSFDKPKRSYGAGSDSDRPKRSYGSSSDSDRPKRSYGDRDERPSFKKEGGFGKSFDKPKRSYGAGSDSDRPKRSYGESSDRPKRSYGDRDERPSFKKEGGYGSDRPKRTYKSDGDSSDRPKRSYGDRDERPSFKKEGGYSSDRPKRTYKSDGDSSDRPKRSYGDRDERPAFKKEGGYGSDRPKRSYGTGSDSDRPKRTYKSDGDSSDRPKRSYGDRDERPSFKKEGSGFGEKRTYKRKDEGEESETGGLTYKERKHAETYEKIGRGKPKKTSDDGTIRLNRYIANAGICSRREADVFIASGVVTVNGKVITEMGFKVQPGDEVTYDGAMIRNENKKYLLLNKPKDYITTMDDPQERKTVMELINGACRERLYPVGRLDRNTTGLLLFTNDGDIAAKLTHPKHNIRKVYHVTLNKKITPEDFKQISEGVELEDGFIKPDAIEYAEEGKKDLGIEIHSGRNRIVRRIFEQLGYEVVKLDRVSFAGLTKKDIPRGKWRFLNLKEVNFLKMLK